MDKIHPRRHTRLLRLHDDSFASVRSDRPIAQLFSPFHWHRSTTVGGPHLLLCSTSFPHDLPSTRLCLEVVSHVEAHDSVSDRPQLPEDVLSNVVSHRSGDSEVQLVRLQAQAGTVSTVLLVALKLARFQKAIKKVRATQRMRRQRGFAFSQTETNNQDQTRLIRAYDTSVARPTGY